MAGAQILERSPCQPADGIERAGSSDQGACDKGEVEQSAVCPAGAHFLGGIAVLPDDGVGIERHAGHALAYVRKRTARLMKIDTPTMTSTKDTMRRSVALGTAWAIVAPPHVPKASPKANKPPSTVSRLP